jgi:beta-lactamase regulating signal transducer with metallopeptidase domain
VTLTLIFAWLLTGALLGLSARSLERAFRCLGLPARFVWLAVMGATVTLPAVVWFLGPWNTALPGRLRASALDALAAIPETTDVTEPLMAGLRVVSGIAVGAWLLLSLGLMLALVWASARANAERSRWATGEIDGVSVLLSRDFGPAVVGFARQRIVLPGWVRQLPVMERRMVLLHEGHHLRAGDVRTVALGLGILVIMPWNPALWWQLRRMRLALEVDCDERVLCSGADRATYAELLVTLKVRATGPRLVGIPFSEPRSWLALRIREITRRPRSRPSRRASLHGALAGALGILACAGATLGAVDDTRPTMETSHASEPGARRSIFVTSDTGPPLLWVMEGRVYRTAEIDLDALHVASVRLVKNEEQIATYGPEARNGVAYVTLGAGAGQ